MIHAGFVFASIFSSIRGDVLEVDDWFAPHGFNPCESLGRSFGRLGALLGTSEAHAWMDPAVPMKRPMSHGCIPSGSRWPCPFRSSLFLPKRKGPRFSSRREETPMADLGWVVRSLSERRVCGSGRPGPLLFG
eukprot:scaffold2857_cov344-Pavlova_lutheri.AAC.31